MTFLTQLGPYFSSHSNSCPSEYGFLATPALTYGIQLLQGLSLSRLVRLCGTFLFAPSSTGPSRPLLDPLRRNLLASCPDLE